MSDTQITANDTNTNVLEGGLKDILDKMLTYFEKFIKTKEDLATIEEKLNDYENVNELVDIIKNVFSCLMEKIDERVSGPSGENYDELEKSLQQHESEIRNHIRIEQQLKLYAESIQAKLDDSEKARTELQDQQKAIISGLKKDNQRLADSFKQKSEEVEKLQATLKHLEEKNKDYETKLQNLPQLQERINHLEKRQRPPSAHGHSSQNLKESTTAPYGIENAKKIDIDFDYSKVNAKPDSARKSIKSIVGGSHPSPLRLVNKTFNTSTSNKTKDTIRVKMEITDPKQKKDLETLKQSYQKFYNPTKSRERERGSSSVQRTRELKSIYSIPVVSNSSNISLIQFNNTNNLSQRDLTVTKLHQRSNSIGTASRHKVGNSFSRA